jgi:transposase-like protein
MARAGERDRGKERFWRHTLRQWRRSGLSVRAFCAEYDLSEPLFYAWRRVIAERDQARVASRGARREARNAAPTFVPLRVIDAPAPASLEVVLERGQVVRVQRGFDTDTLRQLLAVLEEERPC